MEAEVKKVGITREALIEKLIEHRAENWDHDMFDEQEGGLWEAVKPAVYFVLGFLVAYGLAVGLML